MNITPFPAKLPTTSSSGSGRLDEIARILGVSMEELSAPARSHVFHTDDDGTRWMLAFDNRGKIIIERNHSPVSQGETKESISSFLARDTSSPQYRAFTMLIERLLAVHLTTVQGSSDP